MADEPNKEATPAPAAPETVNYSARGEAPKGEHFFIARGDFNPKEIVKFSARGE